VTDTRVGLGGRRLNVLVLARSFPSPLLPNAGLWTLRPISELADRCDVRVISPVPYCPPLPNLEALRNYTRFRQVPERAVVGGVAVHYPRFLVGPGSSLHALEADTYYIGVRSVAERLWRERPFELIHANHIYPDGAAAHRLARRYGVPFVVTEHAPWTGWVDRRSVARHAVPAAIAASSVVAPSAYAAQTIHAYAPVANVRVVPPGVDGVEFPLAEAKQRRRDQILFVGFVNFNKGVDVLLRAMAVLRDRAAPGKLVVVGGAHYRKTLREEARIVALAASLGLGDRVIFAGRQPPHEVARLMGESAVVVLPSRAESFGAVLAEALACGTPVVATRCGGPEDIVTDDVGILVDVGDHVALADAITTVLGARERYAPEALRTSAISRFGISTVAERILAVYEEALEASVPALPGQRAWSGKAA
jgi:glycosyltransferase involved in cell wall biosynthesis